MRPSWKLALIGGEVTVLAAFTGLGIHLAIQPHRTAFRPPPLILPSLAPPVIPTLLTWSSSVVGVSSLRIFSINSSSKVVKMSIRFAW